MKLFLILTLTLPSFAMAEKTLTKKDMSSLGKIDESSLKEIKVKNAEIVNPEPFKTSTKAVMNCKEQDGRSFNEGEVGYDTCLNNLKNRSNFSKRNSGVNANDKPADQSSAGVSFKIGD